jgi:hypothetical protein
MSTAVLDLDLEATDVSGQRMVRVNSVSEDASVGELIDDLVPKLRLPSDDVEGRPLNYQALLEREGRHLHSAERVSDVVRPKDRIVLQPNIDAG